MKRLFYFFVFLQTCCFICVQNSYGQFIQRIHPTVKHQGVEKNLAWLGGLNSPQFSSVDINNDSYNDLFIFDRSNEQIYLLNCNANGEIISENFIHNQQFPPLRQWALLRDYNCDQLPDIFTYGNGGITIYRNTGSTELWDFTLETSDLQSFSEYTSNSYFSSLFVSNVDLPLIDDVDGDGDLDVLVFTLAGDKIALHKNLSQELYGNCDSLHYALKNKCWGYFSEDNFDNSLTLNDNDCPFNVVNPERNYFPKPNDYPTKEFATVRHAGSSLTSLNKQNPLSEILIGDVSYSSLNLVETVKNEHNRDSAVSVTYQFPTNNPINIETFPAAFLIQRGSLNPELFISPFALSGTANINSVHKYSKSGGNWELDNTNFLQEDMLDFGSFSAPIWHDMNGDGLEDLLIGNGNITNNQNQFGSLFVLQNNGSNANPSFELIDNDFLQLNQLEQENLQPTFGDLNNDNREDLIIGTKDGFLMYYINNNTGIAEDFSLQQIQLTDNTNEVIDVGLFASPCLIDIDKDNKLDLIIGNRKGNLYFYKNTGTVNTPAFSFVTDNYANIDVTPPLELNGYTYPKKVLFNNKDLLAVSNVYGEISWYEELTENNATENTLFPKKLYSGRHANLASRLENHLMHVVVGNKNGGLNYHVINTNLLSINEHSQHHVTVFPNPAKDNITVAGIKQHVYVTVKNLNGKTVLKAQAENGTVDISTLLPGIYFGIINHETNNQVFKFIKQ